MSVRFHRRKKNTSQSGNANCRIKERQIKTSINNFNFRYYNIDSGGFIVLVFTLSIFYFWQRLSVCGQFAKPRFYLDLINNILSVYHAYPTFFCRIYNLRRQVPIRNL